jgi:acyl carrier protein
LSIGGLVEMSHSGKGRADGESGLIRTKKPPRLKRSRPLLCSTSVHGGFNPLMAYHDAGGGKIERGSRLGGKALMEVADEVKNVIAKELKLPVEELTDDRLLADVGAESLDVIEIVFALEEKFNIDISLKMNQGSGAGKQAESDLSNFATVGDICRSVKALVDAKAAK